MDLRDILRVYLPDSGLWEESVCGTLLFRPDWAPACAGLSPEDFHYRMYAEAFRAMLKEALRSPGQPVQVALAAHKALHGKLTPEDRAAGSCPTSVAAELDAWHYRQCDTEATLKWVCAYVRELAARRRCWAAGERLLELAATGEPDQIDAMVRRLGQ